jgi:uncharacterized protein
MKIYYLFFLLLISLISSHAHALNFNCAAPLNKIEQMMCKTPELIELDNKLAQTFQENLDKANNDQKQRLNEDQQHWLQFTRNTCESKPCDETGVCDLKICLFNAYWGRQAELIAFYEPTAAPYSNESEQRVALQNLFTNVQFENNASIGYEEFCPKIVSALKEMKTVRIVQPDVQTNDFQDPKLDVWRQQCLEVNRPMNMKVLCSGNVIKHVKASGNKAVSGECFAGFGLPPYRLYSLPPLDKSQKNEVVFYSGNDISPLNMNGLNAKINRSDVLASAASGFERIKFPSCDHSKRLNSSGKLLNGFDYNTIIEWDKNYFLIEYSFVRNILIKILPLNTNRDAGCSLEQRNEN